MIAQKSIEIRTPGRGFTELTSKMAEIILEMHIDTGMAQLFVHHTSASLLICENADPDVRRDLEVFMSRLVPDGDSDFVHTMEGPDDMPAHVRSVLTASDIGLPIKEGRLALGSWQGVYLWEHRLQGHLRRLTLTVYGE